MNIINIYFVLSDSLCEIIRYACLVRAKSDQVVVHQGEVGNW